MKIDVNFILVLLVALGQIVLWFLRKDDARIEECLKHLETNLLNVAKELNDWRLISTQAHSRTEEVRAKVEALEMLVRGNVGLLNDIRPRLAVLEDRRSKKDVAD